MIIGIDIDDTLTNTSELFLMNTPFNNALDEKNLIRVFSYIDLYYKIKKLNNNIKSC